MKAKYLYDNYGIDLFTWGHLIKDGCFICGTKKRLCVDHRHVKNFKKLKPEDKAKEVRGALCFRHNKFTVGGVEIDKCPRETLKKLNLYFKQYRMKGDL